MEKALKILNRLKEQIVDSYTPPYNVEISYTEDFESDIVQAIGELEEAMKPKTCDVCKWNAQVGNVGIFHCWKSRELHYCQAKGFIDYCNEFEPKDNA